MFEQVLGGNSAIQRALDDFEQRHRMVDQVLGGNTVIQRALDDFGRRHRMFEQVLGGNSAIQRALDDFGRRHRMFEQVLGGNSAIQRALDNFGRRHRMFDETLAGMSEYQRIVEVAQHGQRQVEQSLAVQASLALSGDASSKVAATLEQLESTLAPADESGSDIDAQAAEALLVQLLEALSDALAIARDRIQIRALIRLISSMAPTLLTIAGLLLTYELAKESSDSIAELTGKIDRQNLRIERQSEASDAINDSLGGMESRLSKLAEKVDQVLDEASAGTYYIVARPVPLNTEMRLNGPHIQVLLPGQEVELIERSGKWITVTSLDIETGKVRVGWVLKKYLRRLAQ